VTSTAASGPVFSAGIVAVDELGDPRPPDGSIGRGSLTCVRGWVRCESERARIDRVTVGIGADVAVATLGDLRSGLAQDEPAIGADRFWAIVAVTGSEGPHPISLTIACNGATTRIETPPTVIVTRPADPFADRTLRLDDWLSAIDGVYVGDQERAPRDPDGSFLLTAGVPAFVNLWAIDRRTADAPQAVIARAGGVYVPVVDGYTRADAARSVGYRMVLNCGYRIPISPPATGTATIEVFAMSRDGTYAPIGAVRYRSVERRANDTLPDSPDILGSLDEIAVDGRTLADRTAVVAHENAIVDIRGWCIDRAGPRLSSSVDVVVGEVVFDEWAREVRSDVVDALRDRSVRECGFRARVAVGRLAPGRHEVRIRATTARRDGIGNIGDAFVLDVRGGPE
jgi:hypothetical protein